MQSIGPACKWLLFKNESLVGTSASPFLPFRRFMKKSACPGVFELTPGYCSLIPEPLKCACFRAESPSPLGYSLANYHIQKMAFFSFFTKTLFFSSFIWVFCAYLLYIGLRNIFQSFRSS